MIRSLLPEAKSCCRYFLFGSALFVLSILGLHHYANSQVYVVLMGDRELGVVEDVNEVEAFVQDLTERCGDVYGMDLEFAGELTIVQDTRPDGKTDPEMVRNKIRQYASFIADAYMINVDGEPFVAISSEADLDTVIEALLEEYMCAESTSNILEVVLLEELALQKHAAPPEEVLKAEEVVALLKDNNSEPIQVADSNPEPPLRGSLGSRHSMERDSHFYQTLQLTEVEPPPAMVQPEPADVKVRVKTVEEIIVTEPVPFPVETVYDDKMPETETEVTVPGVEGEKTVAFQVVRENGVEVERTAVSEEITVEPETQVETKGLKKEPPPPAIGTGKFVWPVQGRGTVYNGYSSGHRAIDIHIDHGTNVLAADAGVVTYSGYGGTQGNYLIIHHGAYWTLYLHNSKHLVSKGDRVSRGQVIAKVGATGRAFGPHLHFEVRVDDGSRQWNSYYQHEAVNPMNFFNR